MDDYADRRASKRTRTVMAGQVAFNNRSSVIDCTIRDISDTGARITFSSPFDIPNEFELIIPKRGVALWAKRMWSRGADYGVMFFQPAVGNSPHLANSAAIRNVLEQARLNIAQLSAVPIDRIKITVELMSDENDFPSQISTMSM